MKSKPGPAEPTTLGRKLLGCMIVGVLVVPLASAFLCGFGLYRASLGEYHARHGRPVDEWLNRAAEADIDVRKEAIGVLAETLFSIQDPGPMNCAGPDPSIWVERRKRDRFISEVRPRVPEIIEALAREAGDRDSSSRLTAIWGLQTVSNWGGAEEFRKCLPTLISAARDESAEIRLEATHAIIWTLQRGFRGSNDYQGLPVAELVPILTDPSLASHGRLTGGIAILGFIGRDASAALPRLEEILKDAEQNHDLNAAQQAAWAIKRIRGEAK